MVLSSRTWFKKGLTNPGERIPAWPQFGQIVEVLLVSQYAVLRLSLQVAARIDESGAVASCPHCAPVKLNNLL